MQFVWDLNRITVAAFFSSPPDMKNNCTYLKRIANNKRVFVNARDARKHSHTYKYARLQLVEEARIYTQTLKDSPQLCRPDRAAHNGIAKPMIDGQGTTPAPALMTCLKTASIR